MSKNNTTTQSILTLTEGMAGMESQVKGLAQAVSALTGWPIEHRQAQARAPWRWLPAGFCPLPQFSLPAHQKLTPPWPKLLITCGRRSFPYAVMVAQKSKGKTFTVHIQAPDSGLHQVNLIVAPQHDATVGPNVVQTLGAVHHLTRENLSVAANLWAPRLKNLPRPYITVLVGGSNKRYAFTPQIAENLANLLLNLQSKTGGSLLITPSRRTNPQVTATLRHALAHIPHAIWDGETENPYLGWLAVANQVITTADSVSMTTEALATGQPVQVFHWQGGNQRFKNFHQSLEEKGYTTQFQGNPSNLTYPLLNETSRVAKLIVEKIATQSPNQI